MQHLKQPIARRANEEDDCKGHFFEQRFYSGALLSEEAVLAAMAYVDLNPVRAKLARRLAQCHHTSISARLLENSPARPWRISCVRWRRVWRVAAGKRRPPPAGRRVSA